MKKKRILSISMAFILIFTLVSNVFAKSDNTPKEEIVYISTNPDGKVNGTYVVNIFDLDKDQKIIDYGKYSEVKNLSTTDEIKRDSNKISIDAKKGKFFYQGNDPDKELPWNIELKYYKGDKELSPYDIAGQSGDISIKGNISINKKANKIFSDYYLGQLTISIDSKNAVVKKHDDATLAYQGSTQLLNYAILPGKELKFEIQLDSKNFAMNPLTFSAIPFNMNVDLGDIDKLTDGLKELENGISQLDDGTNKLTDGIKQLSGNTALLYSSLNQIYQGLNASKEGQKQLTDGTSQFNSGLKQYSQGIDLMVNRLGELEPGLNQLKSGLISLRDGSQSLTDGLKTYDSGLKEYTSGVTRLEGGHKEFTEGINTMSEQSQQLVDAGKQLVEGSEQIYNGLAVLDNIPILEDISKEDMQTLAKLIEEGLKYWELADSQLDNLDTDKLIDELINSKQEIEENLKQLQELSNSLDADAIIERLQIADPDNEDVKKLLAEIASIKEKIDNLNQRLQVITDLIGKIETDKQTIDEIKSNIKIYLNLLRKNLEPLKEALEKFDADEAYEKLEKLRTFRQEYKRLHDGLVQYTNGTNQLVNGITNRLLPGSIEIDQGLAKLGNGGKELYSHFYRFTDGSSQITNGLDQVIANLDFGDMSEVKKLKEGIDLLLSNHNRILDGQEELSSGLTQLSNGLGQYLEGFGQFSQGANQLESGANQLNSGTSRLKNETSGLGDKVTEGIEEAMKAFSQDGFKLESFVDKENENIKLVQFVYVSDSITAHEERPEDTVIKEETFWDKILDIIFFWRK